MKFRETTQVLEQKANTREIERTYATQDHLYDLKNSLSEVFATKLSDFKDLTLTKFEDLYHRLDDGYYTKESVEEIV